MCGVCVSEREWCVCGVFVLCGGCGVWCVEEMGVRDVCCVWCCVLFVCVVSRVCVVCV